MTDQAELTVRQLFEMVEERDRRIDHLERILCESGPVSASHISIWPFGASPYDFSQGGDEDWVTFVPEGMSAPYQVEYNLGCCDNKDYSVPGGTVFIATHA
jgi:hypothetical protein